MNLDQLKSLMQSSKDIHPKGIQLLKEKMELMEIFFEKYPSLGCSLNTKYIFLMAYTTFSTIINEELKRVLIELNRYEEGINLITTGTLKNRTIFKRDW